MTGVGPPDFIGIGTHLSGAVPWHERLLEHPQIVSPAADGPELHFFDRFCAREMRDEDIAEYHAHFPRRPGTIVGECTPRYVYDAWTLPLLRRAAPDAKLIVILRDPIERYRLHLAYRRQAGDRDEDATYMTDAVHRGRYASQLRALRAFFPAEQVLVLQFERLRADPLGEYRRTLRHLGVDPDFVPRRFRRLARGRTGPIPPVRLLRALGLPEGFSVRRWTQRAPEPAELWPDVDGALHDALDAEVAALPEVAPDLDLSLWPNFGHLAR